MVVFAAAILLKFSLGPWLLRVYFHERFLCGAGLRHYRRVITSTQVPAQRVTCNVAQRREERKNAARSARQAFKYNHEHSKRGILHCDCARDAIVFVKDLLKEKRPQMTTNEAFTSLATSPANKLFLMKLSPKFYVFTYEARAKLYVAEDEHDQ
jgi:hypothetical protein